MMCMVFCILFGVFFLGGGGEEGGSVCLFLFLFFFVLVLSLMLFSFSLLLIFGLKYTQTGSGEYTTLVRRIVLQQNRIILQHSSRVF